MNYHFVFAICAIALPIVAASTYGTPGGSSYSPSGHHANGVEELINAATANHHGNAASLTATADVAAAPSAQPGLAHANAQLHALNSNPTYNNLKNSDSIAETLAENSLAANVRSGNVNFVPQNVVGQTAFRSLLVPNGLNSHNVVATQPLQPIIVNQPGSPPVQISSGPPAVVRANPVVYKLKPSVIYQQEVINKVPTPLSLNPVYVKVYKPGKHVDAPVAAPAYAHPAPAYGASSAGASASSSASEGGYGGAAYGPAPAYASAPYAASPSYGHQSAY